MKSRYKVREEGNSSQPYFVTSTINQWIPIFTSPEKFKIIIQSLDFCRRNKGLRLYAYVIMDNHMHMILSAPNVARLMQSFKSFTSKALIQNLQNTNAEWLLSQFKFFKPSYKSESQYQIWQEGYHPQQIFSLEVLLQKIEYIHNNPVRRGYVTKPEHWQFSSALQLLKKQRGPIKVDSLPT